MGVDVIDVALDPRSGGSEAVYTYLADEPYALGDAVFVPIGSRSALGFVVETRTVTQEDLDFPIEKLRAPRVRVLGLGLPRPLIELSKILAEETLCPLSVALSPAIPPTVQDRLVDAWTLRPDAEVAGLSPAQQEVVKILQEAGGEWTVPKGKTAEGTTKVLKALRTKGLVTHCLRFVDPRARKTKERVLRLTTDAARIDRFLVEEGKRKPAQALTLMCLTGADDGGLTSAEIRAMAGVTESTVKALVDAGFLESVDPDAPRLGRGQRDLNRFQKLAFEAIVDAVASQEYRPFLLFGVTGSGKTEVYLRAAGEALKAGRQVLYLVPEIALAAQAIAQLRDRFGSSVAVLHSELAAGERLQNWLRIRSGEASLVVGARSAIFAPLANLGLLILDEEHEGSYKQEKSPRYHAKHAAKMLGALHRCPVVLGSATPSIESFNEAEREEVVLLSLPHRAVETAVLPTVDVKDLTEGFRHGRPTLLVPELKQRMRDTLDRGEQVILFLNRRAYAPSMMCRDCGHTMQCRDCSVSLSYHRRDGRLKCHQCGLQEHAPETCPSCDGTRMSPLGIGTERVEETIAKDFPDAVVGRLDRDIAAKKGAIEDVLARFRAGEIHVLVGTQMVAKGLDFPNVTLVGVIAADISLSIPDFRSSERTFQLLSQVAGRAGRGTSPGHVVIQTFNPDHPALACAKTHDFVRFYEGVRQERFEAGYPPYRRLINVVFSGPNRSEVIKRSQVATERLRNALPLGLASIHGPTDCALERVQEQWRRHLIVKMPPGTSPGPVGAILSALDGGGVNVMVDVDPYTLM